jgi:hypothetical protein
MNKKVSPILEKMKNSLTPYKKSNKSKENCRVFLKSISRCRGRQN